VQRRVSRLTRTDPPKPAFAGPGHTAVEVVRADDLERSDPFVLLMDDRLDFTPGQSVGEAHPHAGLETVTLMLEGSLSDPAVGVLETGDVEWMTAGRGVVHNESVTATGRARILQLWIALPASARDAEPALQIVRHATLPVRREPGVEVRLYSGSSGELRSPTANRVPTTMIDFALAPNGCVVQDLPGSYAAFAYVIDGSVRLNGSQVANNYVAWFNTHGDQVSRVRFQAGTDGARVLLYAAQPLGEPLKQRGPFVAGSDDELNAFYRAYREGRFARLGAITAGVRRTDGA
jgi:quercetin 2,3-dioxygenase